VKLDPSSVTLEDGFTRDVSKLGHTGTGDLEIRIGSAVDLALLNRPFLNYRLEDSGATLSP
jgi:predicted transport protein